MWCAGQSLMMSGSPAASARAGAAFGAEGGEADEADEAPAEAADGGTGAATVRGTAAPVWVGASSRCSVSVFISLQTQFGARIAHGFIQPAAIDRLVIGYRLPTADCLPCTALIPDVDDGLNQAFDGPIE
jgi:hypothetical protein